MTRRNAATIEPARGAKIRCAIYTRKSTEEGLDQEFNSLDAQREACASYILSQRHEGWALVPELYDDGGFSGGNMDRPGLRQLLADVKAGRVNVIVVYKVDRLTRALSDFAKIVDVLDEAGASFVSITQSFNTTTSMGRLTLNVLLSFAQFEREVISERVRDKIAASKRKGMWMGGNIPLGYDVRDRKLVIKKVEADVVRHIFQRYVTLGNVRALVADLARDGIRAKVHRNEDGTTRGGRPLTAGPLYHILANRIYRGEVAHKGQVHPGEHEAIVSNELWDDVHSRLAVNRSERHHQNNASDPSLLAGMIQDSEGRRMTPSHASKGGVRYRYYVSVDVETDERPRAIRIAAADIERGIAVALTRLLTDRATLLDMFEERVVTAISVDELLRSAAMLSASLSSRPPFEQRELLIDLALEVIVHRDSIATSIDTVALGRRLNIVSGVDDPRPSQRYVLVVPTMIVRRGRDVRMMIAADAQASSARRDLRLVELIVRAHQARQQLGLDGRTVIGDSQLKAGDRNHMLRIARLSFLAPDIVASILEGRQPADLHARKLIRIAALPLDWTEQRSMLGFR